MRQNKKKVPTTPPPGKRVREPRQSEGGDDLIAEGTTDIPRDSSSGVHKRMILKCSPRSFSEIMANLNSKQLRAIKEMGFDNLVHFKIHEVPSAMAYALLHDFNEVTCNIKLSNGEGLHISEADVYGTLGLPRGTLTIERTTRPENKYFIDDVAASVGKSRRQILPIDVVNALKKEKDGGSWFQKLFVFALDAILISPNADGYCRSQIVDVIADLSHTKEYNWCGYVLDELITSRHNWITKTHSPFTGPISFLVAFYVDRVVYRSRPVSRLFPTVAGWTSHLLMKREENEMETDGFGNGSVEHLGDIEKLTRAKANNGMTDEDDAVNLDDDGVQKDIEELLADTEELAACMAKVMKRITTVPERLQHVVGYRAAAAASYKLLGVLPDDKEKVANATDTLTEAMTQEANHKPEWVEKVGNVMAVAEDRYKLMADGPSFDLGFDFNGSKVS